MHNLIDLVTGKPKRGATVQLTVNSAAQAAAYEALKATGLPSGAVAIDPKTGAILALASYPTFNPNKYATFDSAQLKRIDNRYLNDPRQPLLNRAINQTFPPGSTFKVVTSSTAFSTGNYTPQTRVYAPTSLKLPGTTKDADQLRQLGLQRRQQPDRERQGAAPLCLHRLLQHGVREPRHAARRQPPSRNQAVKFGMNDANLTDSAAGVGEQLPADPRQRPRAHRLLGDRPVQRPGHAAAGGHVLGRDRQRRHADDPLHGPEGHRAGPDPAGDGPAHPAEPGGEPQRGRKHVPDDGQRGQAALRHRSQHGLPPEHRHRGQDRDGAERRRTTPGSTTRYSPVSRRSATLRSRSAS